MFGEKLLDKISRSFEKMEKLRQQYLQTQSEAFDFLEQWANLNKNIGIKDVSNQFKHLAIQVEKNSHSCDHLKNMTKMFKDYEDQLKNFKKKNSNNKYTIDLFKKESNLEKDIDVSKSIIFKSKIKKYTQNIQKEFRNQTIFLNAINDMVDQLPDISAIETDDISKIEYTSQNKIIEISNKALEFIVEPCDHKKFKNNLYPSLDKFLISNSLPQTPPPSYPDGMKSNLTDSPAPAYTQILYRNYPNF